MAKGNTDMKENHWVKDIYHSLTTILMGTIKQFVDFLREQIRYLWRGEFEVDIMIWQDGLGWVARKSEVWKEMMDDG